MLERVPSHVYKVGLPFITFLLGGLYGMAYIMEGRVEVKEARDRLEGFPKELAEELKVDISKKKKISLEEEYEKAKQLASADYENKPVPKRN
ncbi:hypothetical protein Gasu2_50050 [Galdieria sulphuraria]|uniref:Uncharacterized protein n=1 Tax=Galdieria sulphuraria TaxID=130081 RepID=M2W4U4_GALSU|nr:uncharacterized protein Gasu_20000 [Galdieria sulphuraria]EME30761.1 hypothetical protein Gasu_20000 [Galdieria sulphuraria]GJD10837.1 hypothetical protein Gasu2_50050 [Galdieria sulphuraria]|eukprot:XP_005707281.1 hypothetical protein Gasu_20000 [Galdieria sulphuraria]